MYSLVACQCFELGDDGRADALASRRLGDVHARDLGGVGVDQSVCAAGHWLVVDLGDDHGCRLVAERSAIETLTQLPNTVVVGSHSVNH